MIRLSILCLLISSTAWAQLPNNSFENLDTNNLPLNWQFTGLIAISFGDSIIEDGPNISRSTDAHSGLYAMELRNSYNYTTSLPSMNGTAHANFPDSNVYQGFNVFIPLSSKPYALDFYYKYAQNPYGDSTACNVRIFNTDLAEIGFGHALVWDLNSAYQLKSVPIIYNFIGIPDSIPAFITVEFKNRINNSIPHVGQRTLIDDVTLNFDPVAVKDQDIKNTFSIYPNPVKSNLIIHSNNATYAEFYAADGSLVDIFQLTAPVQTIDASQLITGMYVIKITDKHGTFHTQKFVKE